MNQNQKIHCKCKNAVKLDWKLPETSSNENQTEYIENNNKSPARKKERVKLSTGYV